MKNHESQQAEATISDAELEDVQGGTSVFVGIAAGVRQVLAPQPSPQGPIFPDVDFDYPKRDFENPR